MENWPNASNTAVSYCKTAAWFYSLFLLMKVWPGMGMVLSRPGLKGLLPPWPMVHLRNKDGCT